MKLPGKVMSALKAVKAAYGHYIEVKVIKGQYCLFEATSRYNPELKRSIKETTYIGWITPEGLVVPARHHKIKQENSKENGETEEPEKIPETVQYNDTERDAEPTKHERDILRALSMNARITIPELTKITGLKKTAVYYHIRKLENRYGIKYLLEIDIEKFGYMNYVAFIKFKDKKPAYEQMKEELEKIPNIQAAMTVKGTCDLVVFMVVKATSDARFTLYSIRNAAFADYDAEWNMMPAYQTFGFIPLRNQFFDVLKEKVWKRTREKPRPASDEITETEYRVLKAMNSNAGADFTAIDNEIGAERGRSNYAYHQLTKQGIIKRSTISMHDARSNYCAAFILHKLNQRQLEDSGDKLLFEVIRERSESDTYVLTCDITSSDGVIMIMPMFKEDAIEVKEEQLMRDVKGIEIETLIELSMLIGSLNQRLFDKKETKQYELLISDYKYKPEDMLQKMKAHAESVI